MEKEQNELKEFHITIDDTQFKALIKLKNDLTFDNLYTSVHIACIKNYEVKYRLSIRYKTIRDLADFFFYLGLFVGIYE